MNEPAKKPGQAPESYQPQKSEMMRALEEAHINTEQVSQEHIVEMEHFEYIDLPAMRFIGMDVMAQGPEAGQQYGAMWGRSGEFMPILNGMTEYATVIKDPCALMHHDDRKMSKKWQRAKPKHYMVGKFMQADAPVPEGFQYKDVPETRIAYAVFLGEFTDMFDKMPGMTYAKMQEDGYKIRYPKGYFHAEVYVPENIPKEGVVSKLGYIYACCEAKPRKGKKK